MVADPSERPSKRQKTCGECGRSFSKAEHLSRHIRSHTKEKPFKCPICGQSCGRQDSLVRHSRLHTRGLATASRERQHHGFGDHREAETTSPVARADRSPSEVMLEHVIDPQLSASLPLGTRPADTGCWTFQSCQDVSCLLTEDFDLRALDSCIADAISGWVGPAVAPNEQQSQSRSNASLIPSESSIRNDALLSFEAAVAVQQKWYSNITPDISASAATGRPSQQDCVDEVYRSSLSHRLQARISDDELPSADFLNLCIKLYFAKFHPVFPVIHAPSFRPSSQNALTLLSICSMGALFVGSAVAAAQGRKIFQRLNKAILASWEGYINRDCEEILSLAQAAIIGQTFGMLSDHPTDMFLAESFHGSVVAWTRRAKMFQIQNTTNTVEENIFSGVEEQWKRWSHAEENARVVLALHVHDASFASMFHHEPLLRTNCDKLPRCLAEEAFTAPSASQWQQILRRQPSAEGPAGHIRDRRSQLRAYAELANIIASIQEARIHQLTKDQSFAFRNMLLSWHKEHSQDEEYSLNGPQCLMVLWHEAFMRLYVDFDNLERFIGRDGPAGVAEWMPAVRNWATSSDAKMCVLHALLIHNDLETLKNGSEPAIHVPRALFHSAIVVYSYINTRPAGEPFNPSHVDIGMPEIQASASRMNLIEDAGSQRLLKLPPVDMSIVCSTIGLLRRLGHFGISPRLASTLEPLVNALISTSAGC